MLDAAPTFADDGALVGAQAEALRAVMHVTMVLTSRGLSLARLELTPASRKGHLVDVDAFRAGGFTINEA